MLNADVLDFKAAGLDILLNYPDCFRVLQPPEKSEHQRLSGSNVPGAP